MRHRRIHRARATGSSGRARPHAARIAHRGPDGEGDAGTAHAAVSGRWRSGTAGWRSSTSRRGAQPMANEDGKVVITFNGEIYNFRSSAPGAGARGHRFRTRSDTETIIHHFEQHGAGGRRDAERHVRLRDLGRAARSASLLARDRVGIKPLYYAELPAAAWSFASELTALLAHGGVDERRRAEGLGSYFFSDYVHPPHTISRGVKKLPPGHTLGLGDGRASERRGRSGRSRVAPAPRRRRATRAGGRAVGSGLDARSSRSSSPTCRSAFS